MFDVNADLIKETNRILRAVVLCEENLFNSTQIDQPFGAGTAGKMSDKNMFLRGSGRVAIDHGIFFGVEAAAVASFVAITGVRKTSCISVVTDRQNLAVIGARDDRADIEAATRRALCKSMGKRHIDRLKAGTRSKFSV